MLGGIDWKMFLSPEMRAGVSVLEGEDPMKVAGNYATGQIMSNGVDSLGGTDALGNSQEKLFNDAGQEQLFDEAIPNQLDTQAITPEVPTIQSSGLPDTGIVGQGGDIPVNDLLNPQGQGLQLGEGALNNPLDTVTPEAPGTFLGLEGKDYTKMGMQGVLAAGAGAMQPTPIQPSKAPVGPGMTKGNPIPQGGAVGVNSMVNPVQPLNSMQMTQAQGLISPFQRDRMRRGQY
jgi:hypothetical protein